MSLYIKFRRTCNIRLLIALLLVLAVFFRSIDFRDYLHQVTHTHRKHHGAYSNLSNVSIGSYSQVPQTSRREEDGISSIDNSQSQHQSLHDDNEQGDSLANRRLGGSHNISSDGTTSDVEAIQRKRQAILKDACARLGLNSSLPTPTWATTVHFLCNDKNRFIFCFAPKVACTTWKGIMKQLYIEELGLKEPIKRRFIKMNELLKDPKSIIKRWSTYRKVMFAREPLNRALSAYLDKFVYGDEKLNWERKFGTEMVKRYRKNPTQRLKEKPFNITFVEFIRYLIDKGPNDVMSQMKDHWLPISSFTHPCQVSFDFIGKYETLAEDGPYVVKKFGLDQIVSFPEIHGSHAAELMRREYASVPEDLIRKLQDYYKMDYELFGYSRDSVLDTVLNYRKEGQGT